MKTQFAIGRGVCYWPRSLLLVGKCCKSWKASTKFKEIPDLTFIFFRESSHFISLAARVSTVLASFLLKTGKQSQELLVYNNSLGFLPHSITDSSSIFILEQMQVVVEQKATLKVVQKLIILRKINLKIYKLNK